jgi:hypothetical protein
MLPKQPYGHGHHQRHAEADEHDTHSRRPSKVREKPQLDFQERQYARSGESRAERVDQQQSTRDALPVELDRFFQARASKRRAPIVDGWRARTMDGSGGLRK